MSQSFDIRTYSDPAEFLTETKSFLSRNESLNNLQLGIPAVLMAGRRYSTDEPVLLSVHQGNRCRGTLVCTPPYHVSLSEMDDGVCQVLASWWMKHRGTPNGVGAENRIAYRFAESCQAKVWSSISMRIFELRVVIAPRPVEGKIRIGNDGDRKQVRQWFDEFHQEAVPQEPNDNPADFLIDGGKIWLWEANTKIVSIAAVNRELPNGVCIGPIYTPPSNRQRGYGTALTAALSQEVLDRGKRYCCLFTDLDNPTSNKIYQSIGYQPVADFSQLSFTRD